MWVCGCVCLFSKEIQTAGWIRMKFGKEVVLKGEGSWWIFDPIPPSGTGCVKGVLGASGASTKYFGKNFIKQKLQGAPDLVAHFWTPNLDLEGPEPPVLLEPLSLTMKGDHKIKVA